ncbi:MAG: DUF1178 family protein [Pseudomonadota bacterium]
MIKYALSCGDCAAEFDAWFASSSAYDDQKAKGLVQCAACSSTQVSKQIMAPAVSGTKRPKADSPEAAARQFFAKARAHVASTFDYVGDRFADEARAIHYGEAKERPIWGATTPGEAKALQDEGVPSAPLPKPMVPDIPPKADEPVN